MQELLRLWSECYAVPCPRLSQVQVFRQKALREGFDTADIEDFLAAIKGKLISNELFA